MAYLELLIAALAAFFTGLWLVHLFIWKSLAGRNGHHR